VVAGSRQFSDAERTGPIIFSQNYILQQLTKVHFYLLTYSLIFILNCKSFIKVGKSLLR